MPEQLDPTQMTHHVSVYEDGKWIGYLTPRGNTNRLKIHASFFTKANALACAADIDANNTEEKLTAKAVSAWRNTERPR